MAERKSNLARGVARRERRQERFIAGFLRRKRRRAYARHGVHIQPDRLKFLPSARYCETLEITLRCGTVVEHRASDIAAEISLDPAIVDAETSAVGGGLQY